MRCDPRCCPTRTKKQPFQKPYLLSRTSSSTLNGRATWDRFVAAHSQDEGVALAAHSIYDEKFMATSRRLGHLAAQARATDPESNLEYQKARSNVRAVLAEAIAYGLLRRDFLEPLTRQLGPVCLVSGEEITGTKIPGLQKLWTNLAPFSWIRFERAEKPQGGVVGIARHFAQAALKTCAEPGQSIKRAIEQFRYRHERYWSQGGRIRVLRGDHQGVWQPEFADGPIAKRWIMLSGKQLPAAGQSHGEQFHLVPFPVTGSQLDAVVDEITQEVTR